MIFPDDKLIIFAKAPIPGKTKKRLIPVLGEEGAAELHQKMLEQKLRLTQDNSIAPVELYCWPDKSHPYFQDIETRYSLQPHNQQGDNLGERMAHAMQRAIDKHSSAVLIGSDSPPLDKEYLITAFQKLHSGADTVIGPAEDGGYVLIGLNHFHSEIFHGIEWGSNKVFQQTQSKFEQLNLNYVKLNTLWDVDRPDDLDRLGNISQY